jgi:hypothetical protein
MLFSEDSTPSDGARELKNVGGMLGPRVGALLLHVAVIVAGIVCLNRLHECVNKCGKA